MIKRKPEIFYTGVLFLCVLFALRTEVNGSAQYKNDTDVTAYLTAKRLDADPWMSVKLYHTGPSIIKKHGRVQNRFQYNPRPKHDFYDVSYPASSLWREVEGCSIQLQFPENDIYKVGYQRIQGKQIDYVFWEEPLPFSNLVNFEAHLPSCIFDNEKTYNLLRAEFISSLTKARSIAKKLNSIRIDQDSDIAGYSIGVLTKQNVQKHFFVSSSNPSLRWKKDDLGFQIFPYTLLIDIWTNSPEFSSAKMVVIFPIFRNDKSINWFPPCGNDPFMEHEHINRRVFVSVADSFELFESPNGLACDHLIGLQHKAVLLTKKNGWVKLGTSNNGSFWVRETDVEIRDACFDLKEARWVPELEGCKDIIFRNNSD